MMDMPGEVSYWLVRATTTELWEARSAEFSKHQFAVNWNLVIAIDEELNKRFSAVGEVPQT